MATTDKPQNKPVVMIHELIAGRREVDVVIRADQQDDASEVMGVIHVTYNPKNMTPTVERAFLDMQRNRGAGAATTAQKMILAVVTDWDLFNNYPVLDANGDPVLDENGQPQMEARMVPLNEASLSDLSAAILGPVMMAIVLDMNPKSRGRNGSGTPATIQDQSPSTSE